MNVSVKTCNCDWLHLCDNCVSYLKILNLVYIKKQQVDAIGIISPLVIDGISHQRFLELTENWSDNFFSYISYCVISEEARIGLRDVMREGNYLMVDGSNIPVNFMAMATEPKPKCCYHEPDAECLCECHKKKTESVGFAKLAELKPVAAHDIQSIVKRCIAYANMEPLAISLEALQVLENDNPTRN